MAAPMTQPPLESNESEGMLSDPPTRDHRGFAEFAHDVLPRWALVRQHFDETEIEDVAAAVRSALAPVIDVVRQGSRVCVAAGSRGIDRIDQVVKAAVDTFHEAGAEVFIVPAMGSHGGATPRGQLDVLAEYGITPEAMGCEIRSSMDTVQLGQVRPGIPVFIDRNAFEGADFIVPINRVKVHTDFTGPIESGLMKMIAIGLGKQRGADTLHTQGFSVFHELIPETAEFTLAHAPIPFGLALLENGRARLFHIEAVPAPQIRVREAELLVKATEALARIPVSALDVLVIDEIGKDISGLGMDSNVVGRYYDGPTGQPPSIQRIVVRDLTEGTAGNGVGLGMAEVALSRAVRKLDRRKTYMNAVTAKTPEGVRIPLTVECDRDAIDVALACCLKVRTETARVVRIRDTKHLDLLLVSEAALPEVLATGRCEVIGPLHEMAFDADEMFADGFEPGPGAGH
jgi:hypothetical protein